MKNFDHEDSETQYDNDEPRTVRGWRFSTPGMRCKEVLCIRAWERCASTSDLRQMWGYSTRVNRKLRLDCPGNPSKLGMDVLKRMANRETPWPGQEWPLSFDVAPPTGMVVRKCKRDLGHLVPCPIPHGAAWVGGLGGRMGAIPPVEQRCPLCGASAF